MTKNGHLSPLSQSIKGCALLTYLVVTGQSQPREVIADLLWDAHSTAQSLRNLRALLVRIRPWLPELQVTRTTLAFIPDPERRVDLLQLLPALQSEDVMALDAGLRLYRGDLLDGLYVDDAPRFNEWLVVARERLRRQVVTAHDRLCETYAAQQQWAQGIDVAQRWLGLDDLDERAQRWLMTHLAGQGQVTQALQQYDLCRRRLWQELEVEPDAATIALANQLAQLQEKRDHSALTVTTMASAWPRVDELAEPGPLPPNSFLPFHRNHHFAGRRRALLRLAERLLPWPEAMPDTLCRVVAISGMAGLGKTQLAVEFAHRYGRYFPGGVFWLNFGEIDNVMEAVAHIGGERALGLYREQDQLTLADQVGRVQKAWQATVPRLLIFDNCEEVDLLAKWLPVTGGSRVLVTSHRGQWPDEFSVQTEALGLLGNGASVALLQQLSPALGEGEAVAIATELGYLPLALHLAGGFLRRYQSVQPLTYLAQLRDAGLLQHPSLQGRGVSHSPTAHELDVARTFALNLARLDPADEVDHMALRLLCHAVCFAPGEPIPQALLRSTTAIVEETVEETVEHTDATDERKPEKSEPEKSEPEEMLALLLAEDALQRLVMLGLLKPEGRETVALHRLLAAFVQKTMRDETSNGDLMRSAQTLVGKKVVQLLSVHAYSGHMAQLSFSAAHLRHITENALARQDEPAVALALLLGRHLTGIGSYGEAETYLQQALQAAQQAGNQLAQVQALNALASVQESMGQVAESLRSAQAAAELFKRANLADPVTLTETLYHIGWAHFRMGHVEAALRTAEEGLAFGQVKGLPQEVARSLNLMGVVNYYLLGEYARAGKQLQESLRLYRELGHRSNQAVILNNLGESARLQGDFPRAATYYEEAITLAHETENYNREQIFISNWCGAQIEMGNLQEAATRLETLIARTPSNWYGLSEAYRFLAEANLGLGAHERALVAAQQALMLAHADNVLEHGRAWSVLGRVAASSGGPLPIDIGGEAAHEAVACFRRGLTFFTEENLARDRAITLVYWADYEGAQGNREKAETLWQQAEEIFIQLKLPLLMAAMRKRTSFSC